MAKTPPVPQGSRSYRSGRRDVGAKAEEILRLQASSQRVPAFQPQVPDYAERVRSTFDRQALMTTLGASLVRVAPGEVAIELPFRADLTQQHGFVHAAVLTAIADTACGAAAFSLMPAGAAVLSVEYKVNLLAPARGERFIARARVLRPGRTLTACAADVLALDAAGAETLVATMLATMMTVRREGLVG